MPGQSLSRAASRGIGSCDRWANRTTTRLASTSTTPPASTERRYSCFGLAFSKPRNRSHPSAPPPPRRQAETAGAGGGRLVGLGRCPGVGFAGRPAQAWLGEKGGVAGAAGGADVTHPGARGVVGRAELLGDHRQGQAVDEGGPQGGVAAVPGLAGLPDGAAARGAVHEAAPHGG